MMSGTSLPLAPAALAEALDDHCERLAACRRCALAPGIVPITSRARGPRAMLVGQAPGQTELGCGKPFAGRAGRTLFKWLESAGIDEATAREWLYMSAMTRCYPGPHPSGRGDRVPTPREREQCGDWLADELRIIRPAVLVPVGRLAIDRFLGVHPLAEMIGREYDIVHEGGRSVVIPLPHPSGASSWIHAPGNRALLDRALALIADRLGSGAQRGVA
jgi:uracil-DNA glycosylase